MIHRGIKGSESSRKVTAIRRKKNIRRNSRIPPRKSTHGLSRLIPAYPNHCCPARLLPGANYVKSTSRYNGTCVRACVRVCTSRISRYTQYRDTRRRIEGTFLAIQFLISCPDPGIKGPSALLGRSSARSWSRDLCAAKKGTVNFCRCILCGTV